MSAISASSVSMKTMADGTLRISFDVEPNQAQDAFKLFAAPGTQVAIAALKDGSYLAQLIPPDSRELKPREQLGDACYRTVLWCNEPSFWAFLITCFVGDRFPAPVESKETAAMAVKTICKVTSRKELDINLEANKIWHREIRAPYSEYLKALKLEAA